MTASPGTDRRFFAFGVRALALGIALFGLLRLAWVETHLLWPFTLLQARIAAWGGGPDTMARVGLSCSGADAIALCLGFILAWPASVRQRVAGVLLGTTAIVGINVFRILTLVRLDPSPWFTLLHEVIWPALLTLASAACVFAWMWHVERREPPGRLWRFAMAAGVCIVLFYVTLPLYLHSDVIVSLGGAMAAAAAGLLGFMGATATAADDVLRTSRGGFRVTGECIATPLTPLAVAAALALPATWRARGLALIAAVPVLVVLGILRLLVLAVPVSAAPPDLVVHAFFQLLLAAIAVAAVAWWRAGTETGWTRIAGRTAAALGAGCVVALLLGDRFSGLIETTGRALASTLAAGAFAADLDDPQRALALLPPFQVGLFVALAFAAAGVRRLGLFAAALALLVASQVAAFAALHAVISLGGPGAPVPGVRLWAIGAPLLLLAPFTRRSRSGPAATYLDFWEGVGREFPDLGGAASTDYYRASEIRLLTHALPDLRGLRLLKTDLWDEAKNTRILQWAERRGARVYGVDISRPTVERALVEFHGRPLAAAAADVRRLPYRDDQFDAIYSMGTIEHFDDSAAAVAEMYRVLKPGGRAIVGVPNLLDPFFRPALVFLMQRLRIYGYGAERAFSRPALRRMLEAEGFVVVEESGILFVPGWLRMLDLACHAWCRPLARVTGALIAPFAWLDHRFPRLRRHGYLLATVAIKPVAPAASAQRTTS